MAVLLFLMAAAIGTATFIENSYDTTTAKVLIYNAKWFEIILFLLMLNFLNNIKRYNLLSLKKWSVLLLHIGFIVALIGSFVTRYFGFEGVMMIEENSKENSIYSSEPYLQINAFDSSGSISAYKQYYFTDLTSIDLSMDFEFPNYGNVSINVLKRTKNASKEFKTDVVDGELYLHLVLPGMEDLYIKNGTYVVKGGQIYSFNNREISESVQFSYVDDKLNVYAPFDIYRTEMSKLSKSDRVNPSNISRDTLYSFFKHEIGERNLISFLNNQITVMGVEENAKVSWSSSENDELPDAFDINVCVNKNSPKQICVNETILGKESSRPTNNLIKCGGLAFNIAYGSKKIMLPFEVGLKDFRLEKYPGSKNASSYESDIFIFDSVKKHNQDYNLFMNHVVDYRGYRFFQSSYTWSNENDEDEGKDPDTTILSVNYDFWGTWITYLGYLMLAVGLLGTLFNPNSRFVAIRKKIIKMRNARKSLGTILLFFSLPFVSLSQQNQTTKYTPISEPVADSIGSLMVQTIEGRIQPLHTSAYDVFHKVSKESQFVINDSIVLTPMQVFVDLILEPKYWKDQKIIYIKRGSGVRKTLKIEGKFASFNDFYKNDINLEIDSIYSVSLQKPDTKKNVFDKELLKVIERFNVLSQVLSGMNYIKVIPIENDSNNSWETTQFFDKNLFGYNPVKLNIADSIGTLLVKSDSGNIVHLHSYAVELLSKISNQNVFKLNDGTYLSSMQVFVDLMLQKPFWENQKLIYINEGFGIENLLGTKTNYASIYDFYYEGELKKDIDSLYNSSYSKAEFLKNDFDKELIEVFERLNLLTKILDKSVINIFPIKSDSSLKWVNWTDQNAQLPLDSLHDHMKLDISLSGIFFSLIADLKKDQIFSENSVLKILKSYQLRLANKDDVISEIDIQNDISSYNAEFLKFSKEKTLAYEIQMFFKKLKTAKQNNDFKNVFSELNSLKIKQKDLANSEIILSDNQIDKEIEYNKSNLFINIKNYYGYISVFLLLFTFWEALISSRKGWLFRIINGLMWLFIGMLCIVFVMHTYALGLRWNITGHAPWSNGYEALTFIAWGGVFAGLLFLRNSKITLAATALLAFFTLMTAGHSSFDPKLTNIEDRVWANKITKKKICCNLFC